MPLLSCLPPFFFCIQQVTPGHRTVPPFRKVIPFQYLHILADVVLNPVKLTMKMNHDNDTLTRTQSLSMLYSLTSGL